MPRKYAVTAVTSYQTSKGEKKDQFSRVGVAFKNEKDGKESISLLIGPEILVSRRTRLVLFEWEEDESTPAGKDANDELDDEVPF